MKKYVVISDISKKEFTEKFEAEEYLKTVQWLHDGTVEWTIYEINSLAEVTASGTVKEGKVVWKPEMIDLKPI